jgi:hypothetical protein
MKKLLIFIIASITLNFCSDSINENETFNLSDTLTLNYGQTKFNSENNLSLQFYSLIGDSRCPEDVVCVWEGDAELKFKLTINNEQIYFTLHTARNYFNTDTTIWNYNINLIDVLPYPITTLQNKPEDYKAVIKITAN